jgi:hypothetical protein
LREIGSCSLENQKMAKDKDPTVFNKLGNSNNMIGLSSKKRERHVAQLPTTKFHEISADESGSGEKIRLNPIMKYLIINGYKYGHYTQAGERKRKKR